MDRHAKRLHGLVREAKVLNLPQGLRVPVPKVCSKAKYNSKYENIWYNERHQADPAECQDFGGEREREENQESDEELDEDSVRYEGVFAEQLVEKRHQKI